MTSHSFIHISRYRTTRYWAVWCGAELIAVTVYRKGAQSVADQLQKLQDYENQTIPHSHTRLVSAA
jgi:3-deoxy-D-arabino-heptulosonate 7-phosphate (DAHP) synthase